LAFPVESSIRLQMPPRREPSRALQIAIRMLKDPLVMVLFTKRRLLTGALPLGAVCVLTALLVRVPPPSCRNAQKHARVKLTLHNITQKHLCWLLCRVRFQSSNSRRSGRKSKQEEKKKDLYALLGLQDLRWMATQADIKKAHQKQCLKHHPDKTLQNVTDEAEQERLVEKFKTIQVCTRMLIVFWHQWSS
jgi:preprotein translocase subunit Sec63